MTITTFIFQHEALPAGQYLVTIDADDLDAVATLAWRPHSSARWYMAAFPSDDAIAAPATDTRARVHLGNLMGPEGNAWAVMGNAIAAYRAGGATEAECEALQAEMVRDSYGNLLRAIDKAMYATVDDSDGARVTLTTWLETADV